MDVAHTCGHAKVRSTMTERTLIVSATHLLLRGFLVVPTDRKSRDGVVVNGLLTVARSVLHVLEWKAPSRAVALVDTKGREWDPLLEPQLAMLRPLLEALGLTVVEAGEEANLVASYTRAALERGDDVVITGADKRYAQLVAENVWWYDANKDARYTPEMVKKRFTVGPELVADWLALVGDQDQTPGVKGIGAKGATGLLEKYPTVEAALEAAESLDNRMRKALEAAKDELPSHLSHARLATRPLPVPLDDCRFRPIDTAALNQQLESLGFVELLLSDGAETSVRVASTSEGVRNALPSAGGTICALLEDSDHNEETIAGIAVAPGGGGEAIYVEPGSAGWPELARWLSDASVPKSGHDLVATRVALQKMGIELQGIRSDSACLSHLSEPSAWAPHDLTLVARQVLGRSLREDEEIRGVGARRKSWKALGKDAATVAAERAEASAAIEKVLGPKVDPALLREYLELSSVLVAMERWGVAVDSAQLDRAEAAFADIEAELEKEITALAGHEFNINSIPQLGKVLFEELKLPIVKHTKTGYSTATEALERIAHAHPIVSRVLRWRLLHRMGDTWLRAFRRSIGPDGRVHSRFHPARSFSGQVVSTNPDLTRVPGRTPEMALIRRAFVAPPGRLLMSVDFNQLGLHVLANLTHDPALVEPLVAGEDMHRLTASAVFEKSPDDVTPDERQLGKVINFATFAGQGASALALELGVPASEAKEYLARFDKRYARVRAVQDEQLRRVKAGGDLITLAGRRWPVAGLESRDSQLRSYAERLAKRGTHEGSVADVSRRALLRAFQAFQAAKLSAMPIVKVIDEVLFEVAESELLESARVASEAMRTGFPLDVPLKVGVWAGKNWADLEPVTGF